jgi:hypothetical protein
VRPIAILALFVVALPDSPPAAAQSPALVVHEWGTFTSFQDSAGATIAGINVDDEPVPEFVHRLTGMPIFTTRSMPALWSQGTPRCHRDVTLRLETPVLYFYPQPGQPARPGFDARSFEVRAGFNGGWLTEFYPFADAENSGFPEVLDRDTRSSLHWKALRLASNTDGLPATKEHVWVAPRAVHSAVVTEGRRLQAEKYLFYRGVGHIDAPLVVREHAGSLTITPRLSSLRPFPELWVVRVQPDGRVRYRRMPAGEQGAVKVSIPPDDASSPTDAEALHAALADALEKQGLFREEALAMLDTWRLSYFESEGTRVMFVLPRAWIDAQLPLSLSVPAEITRVMLGRIELVSAHQRQVLSRLHELPATAFALAPVYTENPATLKAMRAGTASHADLYRGEGREVPEALRLYESLGRFRDALLAHEWRSARDGARRQRLQRIMQQFSACISDLRTPPQPVTE